MSISIFKSFDHQIFVYTCKCNLQFVLLYHIYIVSHPPTKKPLFGLDSRYIYAYLECQHPASPKSLIPQSL